MFGPRPHVCDPYKTTKHGLTAQQLWSKSLYLIEIKADGNPRELAWNGIQCKYSQPVSSFAISFPITSPWHARLKIAESAITITIVFKFFLYFGQCVENRNVTGPCTYLKSLRTRSRWTLAASDFFFTKSAGCPTWNVCRDCHARSCSIMGCTHHLQVMGLSFLLSLVPLFQLTLTHLDFVCIQIDNNIQCQVIRHSTQTHILFVFYFGCL